MLERHAAGCRYNPIKTIKTSFIGTMNMLGLAKRTHARFLLTSTSEVGISQALPALLCKAPVISSPGPEYPKADGSRMSSEELSTSSKSSQICTAAEESYQSRKVQTLVLHEGVAESVRTGFRLLLHVYGEPLEHPQTENYWENP